MRFWFSVVLAAACLLAQDPPERTERPERTREKAESEPGKKPVERESANARRERDRNSARDRSEADREARERKKDREEPEDDPVRPAKRAR